MDFHRTREGEIFYNRTLPDLVRELRRFNDHLDALRKPSAIRVAIDGQEIAIGDINE